MLAAMHGISVFLAVIGSVVLAGWVAERIVKDYRRPDGGSVNGGGEQG